MRVTLVDNLLFELRNGTLHFDLQPHMGLISLIAVLRQKGVEASLFDPKLLLNTRTAELTSEIYPELANAILATNPDVVGFTSLGCNFICTSMVAKHLRLSVPSIPILLGGPHATILDQHIIDTYTQFDIVVRGEAEETLANVLLDLSPSALRHISGLTFRDGERTVRTPNAHLIQNLDLLPIPAFDAYPITELGLDAIRVEAGRGCPFSCTFCSTASFFGRSYRLKSAKRLLRELDYLNAQFGISHFSLSHDLFTVNKKKVREICDVLYGRNYTWSCSARMDCVDDDLLGSMADSGCNAIYYGIETGAKRLQEITKKRQRLDMVFDRLNTSVRLGMSPTTSFIIGYPQETLEEQDETLDMAGDCLLFAESVSSQVHVLTPEPGTDLLNQHATSVKYDGYVSDFLFPLLDKCDEETIRGDPTTFVTHYYYDSESGRENTKRMGSAFWAFAALGKYVLQILLAEHGGRLSQLLRDFARWKSSFSSDPSVAPQQVEDYVVQRHGKDVFVTSLVRYVTAAYELKATPVGRPLTAWDKHAKVQISQNTRLLGDMHICHQVFGEDGAGYSEQQETSRAAYLLTKDANRPIGIRSFVLDESGYELLSRLTTPNRPSQLLASYEVEEERTQAMQLLQDLFCLGCFVTTP